MGLTIAVGERIPRREIPIRRELPGRSVFRSLRWMVAVAAGAAPVAAEAQLATDASRAPTLTIERYPEDWSHLSDRKDGSGRWTERFKYVPLDEDGSIYVTTGVEARSRYEGYKNVNWGSAPDDGYVWHRLMPYADLHVGSVRVFAQPILSAISGAERRARLPVDTTGIDMMQGFAEVDLGFGDASLSLSAGRKLISLGAGRFVDTRYGPGIPRPFDGIDVTLSGRSRQVRGVYLRPVTTGSGDFDDRRSRDQLVWGAYGTQWLGGGRSKGVDLYYLGFRDRNAVFDQGTGRQLIHTFVTRLFGDSGSWFWNVEGNIQRGRFAGKRVEAWGLGGEGGRRFLRTPLQPEIRFEADFVSGDDDPNDGKLGTLNPLFPNGKFLGALTPIGPRNLIHLRPTVAIHPKKTVELALTGVAFWRESRGDGIYSIPGFLVRSGTGSDARFIGLQGEFAAAWQATPELNLSASVSAFDPGRFIRETGPARTIRMAAATANFRF
jgi:hypothetical protein